MRKVRYNIIKFVQLPEIRRAKDTHQKQKYLVVGVTHSHHVKAIRETIAGKEITTRTGQHYKIKVTYVGGQQLEDTNKMAELDILYVCEHTRKNTSPQLLRTAIENHVLVFGNTKDFLESGGIINFTIKKNKLKFEINTGTAEQAGIKIRSQLLKLADKVISKKINLKKTEK